MALTANIISKITADHDATADSVEYSGTPSKTFTVTLTSSDIDIIWFDSRSVAGSETLDLDGTSLTDVFNNPIQFTTLKDVIIINSSDSSSDLTVGGGSNPVFVECPPISAGGCLHLTSEFAVADGTSDNLLIQGNADYEIMVIGN